MPGTLEKTRQDAGLVTKSDPQGGGLFRRLLIVLDDSAAGAAVGLAREWDRTFGVEVQFVRVEERTGTQGHNHAGLRGRSPEPTRVVARGRTLRARNRSLVEGITQAAVAFGADVVVLGLDHRRLASRRLCASVRDLVVRSTDLPVMVAPAPAALESTEEVVARSQRRPHERGPRMFETVVVGCVDSRGADQAFRRALELAWAAGGTLHIVCALGDGHDGPPPQLPSEFRYTAAGAGRTEWHMYQLRFRAESARVRVETHAVLAPPAKAITKIAADEGADLVVVGTGSGHGTRQLSGVPKAVMDSVSCAVLVV